MAKKPAKRSPAFQFYPSDFLGSPKVAVMDLDEIATYVLLLCLDWEEDGFTLAEAREFVVRRGRASPEHFDAMWCKVVRCFETDSDKFFNARLRAERRKQKAWRRKSSKGGKLGVAKRWKKDDKGGYGVVTPFDNTPTPSPTPSPTTTTRASAKRSAKAPAPDQVFEEAWAAYPKRPNNSKGAAWRQWLARVAEGVDPLDMLDGARRYAKLIATEGTEPRYVKLGATFYGRDRHFENDFTPSATRTELSDRIALAMEEEDAALERTRVLLAKRGAA